MRTSLVVSALILIALGCGDPLAVREPPPVDRSIRLFMVLDPDSTSHALFLESLDPGGVYQDLRAELYGDDGALVAVGEVQRQPGSPDTPAFEPCGQRYGSLGTDAAFACVVFDATVERGRSYALVVTARDRPTARARTTVPDAFSIVATNMSGQPPGTGGFDVRWRSSPGAYGYLAFLRSGSSDCPSAYGCAGGWLVATTDTAIAGTIPEEALEEGSGPWTFEVLALDRGLYEYLTSGTGHDLFSVPPVENVDGGHGVLGSWSSPD